MIKISHSKRRIENVTKSSVHKRRVLVLSTNSDDAGAPLHVECLVKELKQYVHFTIVFGEDGPVAKRLKASGFNVLILQGMRSSISPITDLSLISRIDKLILELKPNLIHCHSSKAGLLGRLAGARRNVPVLFTVHGWSWSSVLGIKSHILFLIEKIISKITHTSFLYVSVAVGEIGKSQLGIKESQGKVILNGVHDLSFFKRINKNKIRFIMPARASYPKDHETITKAFEVLSIDSELVFCGGGTDSIDFINKVKLWAPNRHLEVKCLGQRNDIPNLLRDADVMILSSYSEALPLSIMEAMSTGLPIIGSNVGGIPELVSSDQNGYLFAAGNVEALTAAMLKMNDIERRKYLGHESRVKFELNFTISSMANKTLNYYDEILNL